VLSDQNFLPEVEPPIPRLNGAGTLPARRLYPHLESVPYEIWIRGHADGLWRCNAGGGRQHQFVHVEKARHNGGMRVRFDHDFILPQYAEVFFQAVEAHERIVAKSKSSAGQNGVSGSDIKAQPLALAPLPAQH
jgi:hypothetical protein